MPAAATQNTAARAAVCRWRQPHPPLIARFRMSRQAVGRAYGSHSETGPVANAACTLGPPEPPRAAALLLASRQPPPQLLQALGLLPIRPGDLVGRHGPAAGGGG